MPSQTFELLQMDAQASRKWPPGMSNYPDVFTEWLAGTGSSARQSTEFALECLAVANLLPRVATAIEEDLWWGLLDVLAEIAQQSDDWHVDATAEPQHALSHQLLVGELPLTLAYLFPEIRPLHKMRSAAQDALAEGPMELLNGAGLPQANFLPVFRPLVACWTRARAMSAVSDKSSWSAKAEEQYRFAVTKAIGLSSATGHNLLCEDDVLPWCPDFLATMLRVGGDDADQTAALDLFKKRIISGIKAKGGNRVPEYSESCEWSELAILRSDWDRKEAVVAIDFSHPQMGIDVWTGAQRLFHGSLSAESTVNGQPLAVVGSWEETCWFSDPDVDYIELSIYLERGTRLERQVLLARKDKFLLLVDNLMLMNLSGEVATHRLSLPLCEGIAFVPAAESREALLIADKPKARVLPIGLPEWRIDPRIGELNVVGDQLQVAYERPGTNLSCPLFFDLDPKRLGKECTWRQLTVAQSLEIQPHDVAVGYRVQCGKDQWLIYRSMVAPANRTVLGYNLAIEGMVGRFLAPSGEVEELLQIEG